MKNSSKQHFFSFLDLNYKSKIKFDLIEHVKLSKPEVKPETTNPFSNFFDLKNKYFCIFAKSWQVLLKQLRQKEDEKSKKQKKEEREKERKQVYLI